MKEARDLLRRAISTVKFRGRGNEPRELLSRQEEERLLALDERIEALKASTDTIMSMYTQRVGMETAFASIRQGFTAQEQAAAANEQAAAANREARSAGQLTKPATIVVPCTFFASIFSMGEPFAAREHLFCVY